MTRVKYPDMNNSEPGPGSNLTSSYNMKYRNVNTNIHGNCGISSTRSTRSV